MMVSHLKNLVFEFSKTRCLPSQFELYRPTTQKFRSFFATQDCQFMTRFIQRTLFPSQREWFHCFQSPLTFAPPTQLVFTIGTNEIVSKSFVEGKRVLVFLKSPWLPLNCFILKTKDSIFFYWLRISLTLFVFKFNVEQFKKNETIKDNYQLAVSWQ